MRTQPLEQRIISGSAGGGGNLGGNGWTQVRTGTGAYVIYFTRPFSHPPVVTVSAAGTTTSQPFALITAAPVEGSFGVHTNLAGTQTDRGFWFIAVGSF